MRNIGIPELLLLVFLVLLLFGARRVPDIAASIGKAIREFRKASRENPENSHAEDAKSEEPKNDSDKKD